MIENRREISHYSDIKHLSPVMRCETWDIVKALSDRSEPFILKTVEEYEGRYCDKKALKEYLHDKGIAFRDNFLRDERSMGTLRTLERYSDRLGIPLCRMLEEASVNRYRRSSVSESVVLNPNEDGYYDTSLGAQILSALSISENSKMSAQYFNTIMNTGHWNPTVNTFRKYCNRNGYSAREFLLLTEKCQSILLEDRMALRNEKMITMDEIRRAILTLHGNPRASTVVRRTGISMKDVWRDLYQKDIRKKTMRVTSVLRYLKGSGYPLSAFYELTE